MGRGEGDRGRAAGAPGRWAAPRLARQKSSQTMKRTGEDMNEIYKETSLGGLAVNSVEC